MAEQPALQVTLAFSPAPRRVVQEVLRLPLGSTLLQALQRSETVRLAAIDPARAAVGVWGRKAALDQVLRQGDRVEIYRPLNVDPKVARRERFRQQGARATGLFATRRKGAKAGY